LVSIDGWINGVDSAINSHGSDIHLSVEQIESLLILQQLAAPVPSKEPIESSEEEAGDALDGTPRAPSIDEVEGHLSVEQMESLLISRQLAAPVPSREPTEVAAEDAEGLLGEAPGAPEMDEVEGQFVKDFAIAFGGEQPHTCDSQHIIQDNGEEEEEEEEEEEDEEVVVVPDGAIVETPGMDRVSRLRQIDTVSLGELTRNMHHIPYVLDQSLGKTSLPEVLPARWSSAFFGMREPANEVPPPTPDLIQHQCHVEKDRAQVTYVVDVSDIYSLVHAEPKPILLLFSMNLRRSRRSCPVSFLYDESYECILTVIAMLSAPSPILSYIRPTLERVTLLVTDPVGTKSNLFSSRHLRGYVFGCQATRPFEETSYVLTSRLLAQSRPPGGLVL
ncbi:MAG: hypothetical protein M1837_001545, partial [Sclerophora amabilis]